MSNAHVISRLSGEDTDKALATLTVAFVADPMVRERRKLRPGSFISSKAHLSATGH